MMRLLSLLLCFLWIIAIPVTTFAGEIKQVFSVGVVPQFEVRKLHGIWRPILDYLEEKTGYRFKLQGSPTIPDFERELVQGQFDFAYMNPYHFIIARKSSGYVPMIRDHGRKLYGVLVVPKDSSITDPASLNNKSVAFPAPNALGASLQIRQELSDKFGITVIPKYVKTHDSVYLNVLLGEVAAGGGVQKTLNRQKQEYRDNLQVIYTTEKVSPHPLAALPEVPDEVRNRVREALLSMGNTDNGRLLLEKIPIKQIGTAEIADYKQLLSMGLERFYKAP